MEALRVTTLEEPYCVTCFDLVDVHPISCGLRIKHGEALGQGCQTQIFSRATSALGYNLWGHHRFCH